MARFVQVRVNRHLFVQIQYSILSWIQSHIRQTKISSISKVLSDKNQRMDVVFLITIDKVHAEPFQ